MKTHGSNEAGVNGFINGVFFLFVFVCLRNRVIAQIIPAREPKKCKNKMQ